MKNWLKKVMAVFAVLGAAVIARFRTDANMTGPDVHTLTAILETVFALAVAVVIALIAKKYLRRT